MIYNKINRYQISSEIVDGILVSPKPIEIYWGYDIWHNLQGEAVEVIVPLDLKGKPPHWFFYSPQGALLFHSLKNPMGVMCPERKFLVVKNESSYENVYSYSRIRGCYWYVQFKKNAIRYMMSFAEKFGTPHLWGQVDTNATSEKMNEFLTDLDELRQNGSIVTTKDDTITPIPTNSISSVDIYQSLIDMCNRAIQRVLLSHEGATTATPGKLGSEQNIQNMVKAVILDYIRAVETVMNELIEWTVDYNFPKPDKYPKYSLYSEEDVDLILAERDWRLSQTGMIRLKSQYWKKNYGFDDEDFVETVPQAAAPTPTFAEHTHEPQISYTDNVLNQMDEETRSTVEEIIKLIELEENKDITMEQAKDKIIALQPTINTDKIESYIETALIISNAKGKISV